MRTFSPKFWAVWVLGIAAMAAHRDGAFAEPPVALTDEKDLGVLERAVVGTALDLTKIRFDGCHAVDADQIESALMGDLEFQAAVRPTGDLLALLDTLQQRVLAGYQHAGFLDATVKAAYNAADGAPVVSISEGARYRAGKIRVEGSHAIDAEQLTSAPQRAMPACPWKYMRGDVTLPANSSDKDEPALWKVGDPAPGDEQTLSQLSRQVELHLARMGFPNARFKIRLDHAIGKSSADLVITIEAEGPAATVHEIQVEGLTRHTREQLLSFLNVREGEPLTAETCDRVYEALRRSCRFWQYDVAVKLSPRGDRRYGGSPAQSNLVIKLLEFDRVPLLGEPLSEADQCLIRTADWLAQFESGQLDDELVIEGRPPYLDSSRAHLKLVLSPRHGAAAVVSGRLEDLVQCDHAVVAGLDAIEIYDWVANAKLCTAAPERVVFQLDLKCNGFSDGDFRSILNFRGGVRSHDDEDRVAKPLWTVNIQPVTLVNFAHRSSAQTSLQQGVLTARGEHWKFTIDQATGRPICLRFFPEETNGEGPDGEIRAERGQFEKVGEQLARRAKSLPTPPGDKWEAACRFALASAQAQPIVKSDPLLSSICRQGTASLDSGEVSDIIQAWSGGRTGDKSIKPQTAKFVIPADPLKLRGDPDWAQLVNYGPGLADVMFPRGSWPWTFMREASFYTSKNFDHEYWERYVEPEFNRVVNISDVGPLSRYAMVRIVQNLGFAPSLVNRLAVKFADTWDEANIDNDVALIARGDHGLARLSRGLVQMLEHLNEDDRRTLQTYLPPTWAGLVDRLSARRARLPKEPVESALGEIITEFWRTGGQALMREQLLALPKSGASQEERVAAKAEEPAE